MQGFYLPLAAPAVHWCPVVCDWWLVGGSALLSQCSQASVGVGHSEREDVSSELPLQGGAQPLQWAQWHHGQQGETQNMEPLVLDYNDLRYTVKYWKPHSLCMYSRVIWYTLYRKYGPRHLIWLSQTYEKWVDIKERPVRAHWAKLLWVTPLPCKINVKNFENVKVCFQIQDFIWGDLKPQKWIPG